jgi:hypothetical protein
MQSQAKREGGGVVKEDSSLDPKMWNIHYTAENSSDDRKFTFFPVFTIGQRAKLHHSSDLSFNFQKLENYLLFALY